MQPNEIIQGEGDPLIDLTHATNTNPIEPPLEQSIDVLLHDNAYRAQNFWAHPLKQSLYMRFYLKNTINSVFLPPLMPPLCITSCGSLFRHKVVVILMPHVRMSKKI